MGRLRLARSCTHPYTGASIHEFPIAPIGYRTTGDGSPNDLGADYERLYDINADLIQNQPPPDSNEGVLVRYTERSPELESAVAHVLGVDPSIGFGLRLDLPRRGLLYELHKAILNLSPDTIYLARSCGVAIEFEMEM